MAATATRCYGDKIRKEHEKHNKTAAVPSEVASEPPKNVESAVSRSEYPDRFERVKDAAPIGFHELLQKVRPVCCFRSCGSCTGSRYDWLKCGTPTGLQARA